MAAAAECTCIVVTHQTIINYALGLNARSARRVSAAFGREEGGWGGGRMRRLLAVFSHKIGSDTQLHNHIWFCNHLSLLC